MPLPFFITSILTWGATLCSTIKPFIPGVLLLSSYTTIGHLGAYAGSWWSARTYAKNCIGEGLSGLFNSYWTMGSATCMTFLISHVVLIGIAIACVVSTLLLFIWLWYITFKGLLYPIAKNIKEEFKTIKI